MKRNAAKNSIILFDAPGFFITQEHLFNGSGTIL